MKWLKIDYIKQHSRIDYDCEDTILELYANDAERTLLNLLNRTYPNILLEYGSMPEPLIHATLMLVEVSYQHRSPDSMTSLYLVPYTFDLIIKPYIRLHGEPISVQRLPLGGSTKVEFSACLPNELVLADVDFSVCVYNAENPDMKIERTKAECIQKEDNVYIVIVSGSELGEGDVMMRLTVDIPDNDFPTGYNRHTVTIDPSLEVVR